MNFMHAHLSVRHAWYRRWHEQKQSALFTWTTFLAVAILCTLSIVERVNELVLIESEAMTARVSLSREIRGAPVPSNPTLERLQRVNGSALSLMAEMARSRETDQGSSIVPGNIAEDALKKAFLERQMVLEELALTNPAEVRQFVFDEYALSQVPDSVARLSEKLFTSEGTLRSFIFDDFEKKVSREEYYLEHAKNKSQRLALTSNEVRLLQPGARVTVKGVELTNGTIVPTSPVTATDDVAVSAVNAPSYAKTIKRLAIVAINFKDNTEKPVSFDELRRIIFTDDKSVAAYFREVSYGLLDIQGRDRVDGDLYGWITLDTSAVGCNTESWVEMTKTTLSERGISMEGYTNIGFIVTGLSESCLGAAGFAEQGGNFFIDAVGGVTFGIIAHEFGHTLGFLHASSYGCQEARNVPGECEYSEYGDLYDLMGLGVGSDGYTMWQAGHFGAFHKAKHWFRSEQVLTVTESGRYTLDPIAYNTNGIKTIRVKRPFATAAGDESYVHDGYYYLEFRKNYSFDNFPQTGVMARLAPDISSPGRTYWLKWISSNDPLLDRDGGIEVRVATTTATSAVVDISITPKSFCLPADPSIEISPASQWGAPGQTLQYNVVVKNADAIGCGPRRFAITYSVSVGLTPQGSQVIDLEPGQTQIIPIRITIDASMSPGSWPFFVFIQEDTPYSQPNVFAMGVVNVIPDTTPPKVAIIKPLQGSIQTDPLITIEATAIDESGVASIEFLVDKKLVKTCTDFVGQAVPMCAYTSTSTLANGTHVLEVRAVDKSSNRNLATQSSTFAQQATTCPSVKPTVTISPTSQSGIPGTIFANTVSIKNNNSTLCPAATIFLRPVVPSGFIVTQALPVYVSLRSGQSETLQIAVRSSATTTAGKYTHEVQAYQKSSEQVSAKTTYTILVNTPTDTTPPKVSIVSPPAGSVVSTTPIMVSAVASDESGISLIEMYGSSTLLNTCNFTSQATTSTCSSTVETANLPRGTHTIKAVAVDNSAQKNRTETTITVTKQ